MKILEEKLKVCERDLDLAEEAFTTGQVTKQELDETAKMYFDVRKSLFTMIADALHLLDGSRSS